MSKYIIKGLLINKKGLFSTVNCFKTIFKAKLKKNILPVYSQIQKLILFFRFRFILDNKLCTMYSSGSPEGSSDTSENRGEFLEKLQRAR